MAKGNTAELIERARQGHLAKRRKVKHVSNKPNPRMAEVRGHIKRIEDMLAGNRKRELLPVDGAHRARLKKSLDAFKVELKELTA